MLTITDAIRQAMTDLIVDSLDVGGGTATIQIRSGTRPADPATTATGTLLATINLLNPAFGAATGTTAAATVADPAGVTAVATGTASWFRAIGRDGNAKFDGKVGATGDSTADLTLASTSVVSGTTVDVTGGTISVPQGSTA